MNSVANIKEILLKNQKLIIIFVLFVLFVFGKFVFNWIVLKFQKPRVSDFSFKQQGILTDAMARLYAEQLFNAFNIWGTDVRTIESIYNQLKDMPGEVYKVYNAFGTPKYFWFGRSYYLGDDTNLWGWLIKELKSNSPILAKWRTLLQAGGVL